MSSGEDKIISSIGDANQALADIYIVSKLTPQIPAQGGQQNGRLLIAGEVLGGVPGVFGSFIEGELRAVDRCQAVPALPR